MSCSAAEAEAALSDDDVGHERRAGSEGRRSRAARDGLDGGDDGDDDADDDDGINNDDDVDEMDAEGRAAGLNAISDAIVRREKRSRAPRRSPPRRRRHDRMPPASSRAAGGCGAGSDGLGAGACRSSADDDAAQVEDTLLWAEWPLGPALDGQ